MDFSTPTIDIVKEGINNHKTINSEQALYNQIKGAGGQKEQLKKAAEEFESVFITKMLSEMDKTVDRSDSIFGDKSEYVDTFKSIVYQQVGHDLATNSRTSIGIAEQIYRQMEKYVK